MDISVSIIAIIDNGNLMGIKAVVLYPLAIIEIITILTLLIKASGLLPSLIMTIITRLSLLIAAWK